MDYSKMSDFEINLQVNRALGMKHYPNEEKQIVEVFGDVVIFDPSNNPADAWPIITANKISIYAMSEADNRGHWGAEAFYPNEAYHFDDNPLRAAMVVFLMMQESRP